MRDNFTEKTKKLIALRAGYRCSKPGCGVLTIGAASDDERTINVGVIAHITAAAPTGPRYDAAFTVERRKHHSNGILLCCTHAKLVDSDVLAFTIEKLREWKRLAERRSFQEVVTSKQSSLDVFQADDGDVQTTFDLLLDYSKSDLGAFRQSPGWPSHFVTLNLRMLDVENAKVFDVSGLASGVELYGQATVIAAPGTGKTITLLQLAEVVLANAASVAVFIPLGEWATGSDSFFQSLLRRAAYKNASESQFGLLAQHGKLLLILDGWNELDQLSRQRARNDLKGLRRDFPNVCVVISSRHKDFDIPSDGPVIETKLLTEEQQLDLARYFRGTDGESLIDHAWRTPGLRELVAIPLYVTTLLKHAPRESLPTTKEEVLRSFVAELEQDQDKLITLREAMQGFHRGFLEEIAVEATGHEAVALSDARARTAVNKMQERLKAEGQIAESLQPMNVLNALVNAHLLVRSGIEVGGVSFQHQQFQEWFASFRVQQIMLSAAQGDSDANKLLRENILDIPDWEEAVFFACERLSRADKDSINAIAQAILETLGIDPLLSAEMIWRSSDEVWDRVKDDVVSFARKWHTPGRMDRAVKFMIATGCAEFSEFIWPLVSNADDPLHLCSLGAGRQFRPGVLGPNAEKRIAALPEELREHVISEIASYGDMDGIELATFLAEADKSLKIRKSTVDSLIFRRADRFAKKILESSPDEVWRSLAQKWHSHEFADAEVSARIREEADKFIVEETDPRRILGMILDTNIHNPSVEQKVRECVQNIDFSNSDQHDRWMLSRAYELYPEAIVAGLLRLLEQGEKVPFQVEEIFRKSTVVVDDGPLVDRVVQHTGDGRDVAIVASFVGPKTVGKLIDQLLEVYAHINDRYDEYHKLKSLILGTKVDPFIEAVLERSDTEDPHQIYIFAGLISRHGGGSERGHLKLAPEIHEGITATVQKWAEILLTSPEATRTQFAEIAQVAERLESPELVSVLLMLLLEDLKRRKQAQEEWQEARKQGCQIQNDMRMSWTLQYQRAFSAIGDQQTINAMRTYLPDREFGLEAAHVLKAVWRKSQAPKDKSGFSDSWRDFSMVPEAYRNRRSGTIEDTHLFVDYIIKAINELIKSGTSQNNYIHALKLAAVAFSMPYVGKMETVNALLQLPVPAAYKQDLLTVLVLSGETISSELVLRGIDDFLEEVKSKPWMPQEQDGECLGNWLQLLPYTERPSAVLEVLERIEGFRVGLWHMHSLLSALSYAPSAQAEAVLHKLAKRDGWFLSSHDWLVALTNRNTLSAARLLLDLICDASLTERLGWGNYSNLGRKIAELMVFDDQFRQNIYQCFPVLDDGPARSILEYAITEAADTEGIVLLTRQGAARNKYFRPTTLFKALRNVLVEQMSIDPSGMQELHNLPAARLRKDLFGLVVNGSFEEARLATECLCAIDEIRDEYGYVDSEPRHPNIATGVPWPKLDVEKEHE